MCPYSLHLLSISFDVSDLETKYLPWFIIDATLTEADVIDVCSGVENHLFIWAC